MVSDNKNKRFSNAWAISDRSGMKFPISECIHEPGTNVFLHVSESDGMWNAVDHPQANIQKYARFGDPFPVLDAHLDRNWVTSTVLTDENGNEITDEAGQGLDIT